MPGTSAYIFVILIFPKLNFFAVMTSSITVQAPKRRFSVKEYHQLMEAGILQEDDRVELIQGEIIQRNPISPKHAGNVDRIVRVLTFLFRESAIIRSQNPVQLHDYSEPEPDIAVLKPRADFYTTAHPTAGDVLFLIELSDSSLEYDQEIKLPEYAASHIPEYWIVDLKKNQITVYSAPSAEQYLKSQTFQLDELIESPALPNPIVVSKLLG